MASFMQKALQYLGLKDIDDDDFYDDEETPEPQQHRTVYPGPEEATGTSGPVATVRPLVREDARVPEPRIGAVVRPMAARERNSKPHVVTPQRFADVQEIGDLLRSNHPVIVNLQASDRSLGRRMVDFCSGVTYALSGSMEKVADDVFLLTPSNVEVSAEDRQRLSERGLFHQ